MTNEFRHYDGCNRKDPDNCGACALTTPQMIDGKLGINYAGWPLSYLENGRAFPPSFLPFLRDELLRTDNMPYVNNIRGKLQAAGYNLEELQS